MPILPAEEAMQRLKDGNRRYVNGNPDPGVRAHHPELTTGQQPYAVVVGCADSRVPVETVFDAGAGDLFVIRVAGNVMDPSGIGSVEYAVQQLGTRLVVVMGHSGCGAVQATIDELRQPSENPSVNLVDIVKRIAPAVQPLMKGEAADDPDELSRRSVRANASRSAELLRNSPEVLKGRVVSGDLVVVGAIYSLETGEVEFFDVPG
ncbi:MAG: carbonic anhydrase [Balneolaceae bacterium]|nr:carbonic anhydrase [Balneolaceae bacterium]